MQMNDQPSDAMTHRFDTKLVVILRDDLETWQTLNATLFLVSGIAATDPETVGEPYEDASANRYLPVFRQPGLVFEASREELRRAFDRAMQRSVDLAIFIDELFGTPRDAANRAAVRAVRPEDLSLVGIALPGRPPDRRQGRQRAQAAPLDAATSTAARRM